MSDWNKDPSSPSEKWPKRLSQWIQEARSRGRSSLERSNWKGKIAPLREKISRSLSKTNWKEFDWKSLSDKGHWFKWGLGILALFLLSEIIAKGIGLFIQPKSLPAPPTLGQYSRPKPSYSREDFDALLRRNMFNVEGKIPDPLEQGQMDCFSQARPSSQRISLLGTIVMNDESLSVALIQEEGGASKIGVKKDELFGDGKYLALKVDRKKLCFQVKATQEFEYIEIPDEGGIGLQAGGGSGSSGEGIQPVSETEYKVESNFLEKNLLNLNEILQTARAIPYNEGGQFKGFLIQSIDATSPFAQLGLRQGDVLTGVNNIVFDNPGKGLEAFQTLRTARNIKLDVIRSGQKTTMNYDVK